MPWCREFDMTRILDQFLVLMKPQRKEFSEKKRNASEQIKLQFPPIFQYFIQFLLRSFPSPKMEYSVQIVKQSELSQCLNAIICDGRRKSRNFKLVQQLTHMQHKGDITFDWHEITNESNGTPVFVNSVCSHVIAV